MNIDHASWLREGVKSWNRRRRKIKFTPSLAGLKFFEFLPPDFRDTPKTSRYFEKIDLSGADLRGSDLSNLNFANAKFKGADLANADLSLSNFNNANFVKANLSNADISNSHFNHAIFDNATLTDVAFDSANLVDARFTEASLSQRQMATIFDKAFSVVETVFAMRSEFQGPVGADAPKKKPPTIPKYKYDVFYATNRVPIYERGMLEDFGSQSQDSLSYGVCEVIVPDGHRVGELGSPLWKRLLNRRDDRLRIDQIISLNQELFWQLISDTASKMAKKHTPTMFIHGYNTSFKDAVVRSAQLGYDLGLGQGIGLFSWPSKASFGSYAADAATAEASRYVLADFIEEFVNKTPEKKVNLIAHSMGCRCLVGALEVLSNRRVSVLRRIEQVILAAADVDTKIMPLQSKHIIGRCKRVTSYVSDRDKALLISGWLRKHPRVGFSPPTFVLQGMDTILVNSRDLGDFSHGYFAKSRDVIKDIFDVLKKNAGPEDRLSLVSVTEGESKFWRMLD
jgi:esterase/lipase superfamily enzyme